MIRLMTSNTALTIPFQGGGKKNVAPRISGVSTVIHTPKRIIHAGLGVFGLSGSSGLGTGFTFHGAGFRHLGFEQYAIFGGFFCPQEQSHHSSAIALSS
jgi:hypothetical protein